MNKQWGQLEDNEETKSLLECYVSEPFVTEKIGLVLMHHRGHRLGHANLRLKSAFQQFGEICQATLALSKILPHGDVLSHNIVVSPVPQKLTLIDIDEGVRPKRMGGTGIAKRKNSYKEDDEDWFKAISYPNPLRSQESLYTKVQLLATFFNLMVRVVDDLPVSIKKKTDALLSKAKALGSALKKLDKRDKRVNLVEHKNVVTMVNDAENDMNALL
ncbi:MAG: hypothetical protein SGARI_006042, partial [Bacillariaceae sp.]